MERRKVRTFFWGLLLTLCLVMQGCSNRAFFKKYGIDRDEYRQHKNIPVYISALSDKDPKIRSLSFRYLGQLGLLDVDQIEEIKGICFNDSDPDVRIECINCVKRTNGDYHDIEIFYEKMLAVEQNKDVRKYIIDSKKQGISSLATLLFKADANAQFADENDDMFEDISMIFEPKFFFYNGHRRMCPVRNSGALPLKIKITNSSSKDIIFQPGTLTLKDPDGNTASKLDAHTVYETMDYSMVRAVFGVPVLRVVRTNRANNAIARHLNDLEENELRKIPPSTTAEGVIFFNVPSDTTTLWKWMAEFSFIDGETNRMHAVNFQLGENISVVSTDLAQPISPQRIAPIEELNVESKLKEFKK